MRGSTAWIDVPTTKAEGECFFTILKSSNSCFEMGISQYEYLVLGLERMRPAVW